VTARRRSIARLVMLASTFVFAVACKRDADVPVDFAEQLSLFRAEHEAEIGGPSGPLATVDAWYVEPGHRLEVWIEDGRAIRSLGAASDPASPKAALSIVVDDEAIACTRGCGPEAMAIDEAHDVAVPPLSLGLSAQSGGLRVLVHDPQAPARVGFSGLSWHPPQPAWWLSAELQPTPQAELEPLATTRGLVKPMRPAGSLALRLPTGEAVELVAYEAGPGELLVPFTDATNGDGTYDVGRYLTVRRSADAAEVAVDFNRATNPWCAYSEHYNCPIPPARNRIVGRVEAGERHPR
jgi:hypothetical protein